MGSDPINLKELNKLVHGGKSWYDKSVDSSTLQQIFLFEPAEGDFCSDRQKVVAMKKRRLVALAVAVIVVALMLEAGILKYVNDKTTYRTSEVLLGRVLSVLEKNDESETDMIESLKADYIVRARAVAYILDAKPEAERDVDELRQIAKLISVDEIHLLDQTGMIYSGTLPEYFGYNFDSGEQMAYFKPMLADKQRSMCQDVTPNTAEGKEMMYAIVWDESASKMIQVGITPKHLLKELEQNQVSAVVENMPVYKSMDIYVADPETKQIEGATDRTQLGRSLEELGIDAEVADIGQTIRMDGTVKGKACRCMLQRNADYLVVITEEKSVYFESNFVAMLIVGVYLILASSGMIYMLSKVMKEKYEKERLLYTSITDELTRCGNRHAYETDIAKLDLQAAWAYLSMDVNGLKLVNDTCGHAAGDELICAAAETMKRRFADVGRVYRIGGDEFVVIVTGELEALDARLQDFDVDVAHWKGELVDTMSIAWGYVLSTEQAWESVHEISKAADKRMYERKAYFYRESGMNRRKS